MSEQNRSTRFTKRHESRNKRLEVAEDIKERIDNIASAMDHIPGTKQWDEFLGYGADKFWDESLGTSILQGMINGAITVGDPRLVESLRTLENAIRSCTWEQMEQKYRAALPNDPHIDEHVKELRDARLRIDGITHKAIMSGLTTPGQDLYAEHRGKGKDTL